MSLQSQVGFGSSCNNFYISFNNSSYTSDKISYLCLQDRAFVDTEFRGVDLKSLNFGRKYIHAVSLADIASIDGHRISHQAFEAIANNGLRNDTD